MDDSRHRQLTIVDIPPEILNHIFTFLLVPSILNQFRIYSVGRSFWSMNLRDLKAISSVCKEWREESIHHLYGYVTIYRPHHLEALLESLQLNSQYARHIRRCEITAAGAVAAYSDLERSKGSQLFMKLFQQCPNLTSLTIGPGLQSWGGRAFPVSDCAAALAQITSQITDLTLGADYLESRKEFSEILIALGANLTSLSIQNNTNRQYFSHRRDETGNQYKMYEVRLPVLQSLVLCCVTSIAAPLHWEMRSLRALTIHYDAGSAILRRYGAQLKYLCVLSKEILGDSIERYCPSLEHLVMPFTDAPPPGIKHVDFWVEDARPKVLSRVLSTSRCFTADLLHPEFGYPTLPYFYPPTNHILTDVDLAGEGLIRITKEGRLFTSVGQEDSTSDFSSDPD